MKYAFGLIAGFVGFFTAHIALASGGVPADALSKFLSDVLAAVANFGGLSWMAKVAVICTLLIGSMKVDVLREKLWDKLGKIKGVDVRAFLAPIFGLAAGIFTMKDQGTAITIANSLAWAGAGAGAIILYELLDAIGLAAASNKVVSAVVGFIKGLVKKPE